MLTKTTVLLSAIAAASATGLRSNSAITAAKFKEALRVTEVEQSFIEQTSSKYECPQAANLVEALELIKTKIKTQRDDLRQQCSTTNQQYVDELTEKRTEFINMHAKAEAGKTYLPEQTTSPASRFEAERARLEGIHADVGDAEDAKTAAATKTMTQATEAHAAAVATYNIVLARTDATETRITATIEQEKTLTKTAVEGIEKMCDDNKQRVEDDSKAEKKAAKSAHDESSKTCQTTYDAHMVFVKKDQATLDTIRPLLSTLKLCPAPGSASSFLEIGAAQRVEASCALSRTTLKSKTKSIAASFAQISSQPSLVGDDEIVGTDSNFGTTKILKVWDDRVIEEKTIATDAKTKCVDEATKFYESEVLLSDSKASKLKKEYEDIAEKEIKSTNENLKETVDPLNKQLESNAAEASANKLMLATHTSAKLKATKEQHEADVAKKSAKKFAKVVRDEGIEFAKKILQDEIKQEIATVKELKNIQEDKYALKIATYKQNCASDLALLNDEAATVDTINSKLKMLELIKPQDLTVMSHSNDVVHHMADDATAMENFGIDMPEDSTEKEVVDVAKIKSPLTEEEDTFNATVAAVAAEEITETTPAPEITETAPAPDMTATKNLKNNTLHLIDMTALDGGAASVNTDVGNGADTTPSDGVEDSGNFITRLTRALRL